MEGLMAAYAQTERRAVDRRGDVPSRMYGGRSVGFCFDSSRAQKLWRTVPGFMWVIVRPTYRFTTNSVRFWALLSGAN